MLHHKAANALLQGKATRSGSCVVSSGSRRVTRRRAQAFKGSRRLVTVAAAEAEAAPEAAPAPAARAPAQKKRPLSELQANEYVEGRVMSVQTFGAFVDIGAESQGLIHISQLTDGYVKNVADVIKVGDVVKARILSIDVANRRLALSRKGMGARSGGGGGAAAEEEDDAMLAALEDVDPNTAEVDGLTFVVEDDEAEADAELDPSTLEFVDEIDPAMQRDIDIACEDIVTGTVSAIDRTGVTVAYTLEDGTAVEGLIHISELLAPAQLAGDEEAGEGEEYVEVDNIDPAKFYKVGDSISCFVFDVEDGEVQLTQRLYGEADDELLELAEAAEGVRDIEQVPDALLVQGMWAAEEEAGDDDEDAVDGDLLLAELDPSNVAAAVGPDEELEDGYVAAVPEQVQSQVLVTRANASAVAWNTSLMGTGVSNLRLPDRPVGDDVTASVTGALLESCTADNVEEEEDELIGVSTSDLSYVPRELLVRMGYRIVKEEESGEWQVAKREPGAEDVEIDAELQEELEYTLAGRGPNKHEINRIVADLMADDEADEAEVPLLARRTPVVAAAAVSAISAKDVSALRKKTGAGMMDCKKALGECDGDADKAVEWLRQKGLSGADKKAGRVAAEGAIVQYIHPGSRLGVLLEVNCETDFVAAGDVFNQLAGELAMIVASSEVVCVSVDDMPADLLAKEREVEMGKEDLKSKPEAVRAKIVEGRLDKIKKNFALLEQPALRDNNKSVAEIIKEAIAATGENIQVRRFQKYNLGEGLEKRSNDFAAEVAQQTQAKAAAPAAPKKEEPKKEEPKKEAAKPAVQISAGLVKQLRDKSGAGMMDCKKALAENGGDIDSASEWLRKKGLASADKKAGRLAAEGALLSYIHPGSRLGVLLEVNCETDFVAAGDVFNRLANTLAMQIAASPSVEYVASEEIPAEVFEKEKEIEMGREDLQSKPEAIRAKIAEGRVKKLVQERVLLEQPYLLDQNKTVAEAVKEAIAACGENIQIRRFSRYVLGEGVEKKQSNLAEEVAAATGGKA